MNLADFLVLGIILLFVFFGYSRGLIRAVFGLISFFAALVLAGTLFPVVKNMLIGNYYYEGVKKFMLGRLSGGAAPSGGGNAVIDGLAVPEFVKDSLQTTTDLLPAREVGGYISSLIVDYSLNIILMITLFIIIFIGIKILAKILNLIARLPVLNIVNRLLGAAFGGAQGIIVVWIIFAVLAVIYPARETYPGIELIESSAVASMIYENNVFMRMLIR